MKIKYLRDKARRPYGVVIYKNDEFFWSLCHPDDKNKFSKARAKEFALNRPYNKFKDIPHTLQPIVDDMKSWLEN